MSSVLRSTSSALFSNNLFPRYSGPHWHGPEPQGLQMQLHNPFGHVRPVGSCMCKTKMILGTTPSLFVSASAFGLMADLRGTVQNTWQILAKLLVLKS